MTYQEPPAGDSALAPTRVPAPGKGICPLEGMVGPGLRYGRRALASMGQGQSQTLSAARKGPLHTAEVGVPDSREKTVVEHSLPRLRGRVRVGAQGTVLSE